MNIPSKPLIFDISHNISSYAFRQLRVGARLLFLAASFMTCTFPRGIGKVMDGAPGQTDSVKLPHLTKPQARHIGLALAVAMMGLVSPCHAAMNASQTLVLQTAGTERARLNTLGFETNRVSTTYISTTLIQASGTPTANNHLTTKAYVDAAIAAASNGGSRPTYMGITSTTYTGALGGILGANDKCNTAYTGSRVMLASDIAKADYTNGVITTEGWLNCDIFRATTCYNSNLATGTCVGWSSSASNQDGATLLTGGSGNSRACSGSFPIHCVKD